MILRHRPRAGARAGRAASTRRRCSRSCACPTSASTTRSALAHEVRMRWCGPEVEVEGIVSLKTGGCPEDCHFCSQSGRFETPVRAARLDIPSLVEAARETAATGATEFCIVAAVRGPDAAADGRGARGHRRDPATRSRSTSPARSASSPASRPSELAEMGVHRYNHNLETARSHFAQVVTTHTWEERWDTLQLVRELRHGGVLRRHHRDGRDARAARRARGAARRARARRGAAELPRPAPGHAVRGPRRSPARRTRCGRSPRSGSRCRARSCASPAGASSRSATSARARA